MITKRIAGRKDARTSAVDALRYGEGLKRDRKTDELLDKSHRTRFGNFGLVDGGVYAGRDVEEMAGLIELAATEMQSNCDLNTRVGADKKIAHFVVSFNQSKPSDAALRDTEDSMLLALKLNENHFATFLHSDNGYWHLHIFASRIDKIKHLGNPLWQDKTIRDRVCREIEIRHNFERDNGLHKIDEAGQIVEVPREERKTKRDQKIGISDRARTTEIYSGEKSFQTWVNEIRIGDRLRHAKSWQDLHAAAAEYGCEIKQRGAGFVICPIGEKGGIQLSKIGLKNLPAKFGAFQAANYERQQVTLEATYKPSPTNAKGASHYSKWQTEKKAFKSAKTEQINGLREAHKNIRQYYRELHRSELKGIRTSVTGDDKFAAVSVAKMQHAIQITELAGQFKQERKALFAGLATQGPGNTFREYLVLEARKGDNVALGLARNYGLDEATDVSREHEASRLRIRVAIAGQDYLPTYRLRFIHQIEESGTVVYHLGRDRLITDSATAQIIQLNDVASHDPEAIATALRFATLKFGPTLTLTGPEEFQRLAVETAVRERLGIKFADPVLEAYRQQLAEEQKNLPTFQSYKEKQHASNHRIERLRQTPPAHIRDRLHNVPLGDLVLDTGGDISALRSDVSHRLEQQKERDDRAMQRTAGRAEGIGDARGRSGTRVATECAKSKGGRKEIPLIESDQAEHEHSVDNPSAKHWVEEWCRLNHKEIVEPRAGDGKVLFNVIHIGRDGIVLDMGRAVAIYPMPNAQEIMVGSKVTVGKSMEILLLQKTLETGKER